MAGRRIGVGGPFLQSEKSTETSLGILPAPIWVTLVVQKNKRVASRTKTKSGFIKPVRFTSPVLIQVFPEYLIPIVRTKSRKVRTGTTKFIRPVKSTGVTVTVHVKPIKVISLVKLGKNKTKTQIKLGKPIKTQVVVVVVKPQKIRVIGQIANRRRRTVVVSQPKFSRSFGRPTAKTVVRSPKVISFATRESIRKRRFVPVRIIVGKIPRTFGSSPVGSVVIFYDGLNVADGLTYHHGLGRPHITLVPAGGGNFFITKDVQVTEEKSDSVLKETYLIDGDIP